MKFLHAFIAFAAASLVSAERPALAQTTTYGPIVGRGATSDSIIVKWGTDSSTGTASFVFRPLSTGDFKPVTGTETQNSSNSYDHQTVLTGLALGSVYEYQITGVTQVQTHRTSTCPAVGAPLDLVFYGDSRNQPLSSAGQAEHTKIISRVLATSPDIVFESGDIVYTGSYSDYLSQFFPVVGPLVSSVPFMAVPGNHDSGDPLDINSGGLSVLTANFAQLFPTPQADPANWKPYYSFSCGNAMFIGLDSESLVASSNGDAAQTMFLSGQLAIARAQPSIDHVFVWFHHSPYSPASGLLTHGDNATVQSQWVPLFDDPANKVTGVFTGHDHIYARMNDGSHVAYVVSGGAGAGASAVGGTSKATTEASKQTFGFVQLHVAGKVVTGTAYDDTGTAFDQWTMQSSNSASGGSAPPAGGDVGGSGGGAPIPSGQSHAGCSLDAGPGESGSALFLIGALIATLGLLTNRRNARS
jgi:hypothetical protein